MIPDVFKMDRPNGENIGMSDDVASSDADRRRNGRIAGQLECRNELVPCLYRCGSALACNYGRGTSTGVERRGDGIGVGRAIHGWL